jgi:Domain of unknown function (DUF4381)
MSAPGLEKLHDFQQPAPPSWMPHTTAWYVLFAVVAVASVWIAIRMARMWWRNRYRREALTELESTSPEHFSALLKRTALAAWPREAVAQLNGREWLKFLDGSAEKRCFGEAPGNRIEEIAFSGARISADEERTLRALVAQWIRRHRVPA